MSPVVLALVAALGVWMALCAWCGFRVRVVLFFGVLAGGLALNQLWMMVGLKASALEHHLIFAQVSAVLYALVAFGCGWLAGRLARQFRESAVE